MHSLEKLVEIMEREYELHSSLLELSHKKTNVIVDGKINDLEKLVETEQYLVLQLVNLEGERESCVEDLARQLNMDSKDVTVSHLISLAEGELKERLEELQQLLSKQVNEQKRINQLNERLIKNNLEYINFSLGLLTGRDQAGNIYNRTGGTVSKQQERNLIDKEA